MNRFRIKRVVIVGLLLICTLLGAACSKSPADSDLVYTCTMSVVCTDILDHLDEMDESKRQIVPDDGIIIAEGEFSFAAGETVFDVLQRELKRAGVHYEFSTTPGTGSSYLEGIANLYEFDCGANSGWVYYLNGDPVAISASSYELTDKDEIVWFYCYDYGVSAPLPE